MSILQLLANTIRNSKTWKLKKKYNIWNKKKGLRFILKYASAQQPWRKGITLVRKGEVPSHDEKDCLLVFLMI